MLPDIGNEAVVVAGTSMAFEKVEGELGPGVGGCAGGLEYCVMGCMGV